MKSKFAYWMRAAPVDLREELAKSLNTSLNVLYAIASGRRGNPTLYRAVQLVRAVEAINNRNTELPLPPITLAELYAEAEKYAARQKSKTFC